MCANYPIKILSKFQELSEELQKSNLDQEIDIGVEINSALFEDSPKKAKKSLYKIDIMNC